MAYSELSPRFTYSQRRRVQARASRATSAGL